jgi:hypothetical protein
MLRRAEDDRPAVPDSVRHVLNSPGEQLPPYLHREMQTALSADLTGVRIHNDARAAASAHQLRAKAWTLGQHVAFAAGAFAPETEPGRRLLTHELAHVLQQKPQGGSGITAGLQVGSTNDPAEREAEQVASFAGTRGAALQPARTSFGIVRRVADFEVGGIEEEPGDVMNVSFKRGSSAITAAELPKIDAMITAAGAGAPLVLDGYASEDEPPALAMARASAVDAALAAATPPHTGARTMRDESARGRGVIEYRTRRKVEVQTRVVGHPPPPPHAPAARVRPCGGALGAAKPRAIALLDTAIGKLAPPRTAAVDTLLSDLFDGASGIAAAGTIKTNLTKLRHHISAEIGPAGTVACHTERDGDCVSPAFNEGTGAGPAAVMTLCPEFLDNPGAVEENAATLIHEAAHGTVGLGTKDLAYGHTRLIQTLTTAQALTNSDSYVLLVRNIGAAVAGTPPVPIGIAADSQAFIPDEANKKQARLALAHTEKWLTQAYQDVSSLYDTVVVSRAAGSWTGKAPVFNRATMHLLAMAGFPITDPGAGPHFAMPTWDDQLKIAAIYDRFMAMRDVMWSKGITMKEVPAGPGAWAPGPGATVELSPPFFALSLHDQIHGLIMLLLAAHPGISPALWLSYAAAADAIRSHHHLGP